MGGLRRWGAAAMVLLALAGAALTFRVRPRWPAPESRSGPVQLPEAEARQWLEAAFAERARAILTGDTRPLVSLYDTEAESGRRALEHEEGRVRYVRRWAANRGVTWRESLSRLQIRALAVEGRTARVQLVQSARFAYAYPGAQGREHRFGIGTRHRLELVRRDDGWRIRRDEYTDPLEEDTLLSDVAPACGRMTGAGLATPAAGTALPAAGRAGYDRAGAVAYADRYCGAAWGCGNGGRYNPRYPDYTDRGGDCTNFVSQALGDPEGGRLAQTPQWHYDPATRQPSVAWIQTDAFARFLAGRARLLARGTYAEVRKPRPGMPDGAVAALRPGDVIGYEEGGNLVHFAIVTGRDAAGLPVVNSHTADRYRAPWDLGWDRRTVYWLYALPD